MVSMYAHTVSYFHAAAGDIGMPSFEVTGADSFARRREAVEEFRRQGGVLVGTDAALEGAVLGEVNHVVHYDVPSNRMALEQRNGRFDRFGREIECEMYVLRDDSGALPSERQNIEQICAE